MADYLVHWLAEMKALSWAVDLAVLRDTSMAALMVSTTEFQLVDCLGNLLELTMVATKENLRAIRKAP